MKKWLILPLLVGIAFLSIQFTTTKDVKTLKTETMELNDSISYAIGVLIGQNLKGRNYPINEAALAKGVKDVLANTATLTPQQAQAIMQAYDNQQQGVIKQKNAAFLDQNAGKEGVTVTASGLQYKVIRPGTGAKPTLQDKVTVHYEGKLIDGSVFDSSYKRGEPTSFPLGGVVKGWQEGLQLMPVGSKYELYLPYNLAYGERGTRGIPPFSTLIFTVELIEIGQ